MQDLKVTLVQFDQIWEDISANINRISTLLENCVQTDLVVLPEMYHTAFSMNVSLAENWLNHSAVEQLKSWSRQHGFAIYTSLMVEDKGKFFNRGVFVQADGAIQFYDKRRSFGLGGEDQFFHSGESETIVTYLGWKINLQICYDLRFPELIRNRIEQNGHAAYDVLLYVANWPKKRISHWTSLLPARAIENQCYVVGVNRVGIDGNQLEYSGASAAYDGLGQTLAELNDIETLQNVTLSASQLKELRQSLPFLKDRK
ncbi:MAG: nitrilase-related carbon-nitrogen hydrolase [Flavobacteriales bacterium]